MIRISVLNAHAPDREKTEGKFLEELVDTGKRIPAPQPKRVEVVTPCVLKHHKPLLDEESVERK
jgi:hypothetical protein